jgi:hypothetical protein
MAIRPSHVCCSDEGMSDARGLGLSCARKWLFVSRPSIGADRCFAFGWASSQVEQTHDLDADQRQYLIRSCLTNHQSTQMIQQQDAMKTSPRA